LSSVIDNAGNPSCGKRATRPLRRLLLLAALLWLCAAPPGAQAQSSAAAAEGADGGIDTPISTDRPSVGTGPDLVPAHRVIVENGIAWAVDRGATRSPVTFDGPETLLRVGVSRDLELRATLPNYEHTFGTGAYARQDFGLSAKIHLPSSEKLPLGAILGTTAPTGSVGVTAGGWDPSALFCTSHVFTPRLGSFASADVTWAGGGAAGRQTVTQLAFAGLWNTTATVSNFIEYAPLFSTGAESSGYTLDTGVLWIVHRFIQFDIHAGRSWAGAHAVTVAGLGFSFSARRRGIAW
jgi:hypothetical protein